MHSGCQTIHMISSNVFYISQYSSVKIFIWYCAILPKIPKQNAESQHAQWMMSRATWSCSMTFGRCVCVRTRARVCMYVCVCSVKDAKWVCCTCVCVCTCAGAHKSRNKYVRVLCVLSARGRPALICGKINISTCQPLITRLCPFFDYMRFAHTHRPTYPPTHAPTRPPTHSPTQPPTHACVCTHAHSAYADGTEE